MVSPQEGADMASIELARNSTQTPRFVRCDRNFVRHHRCFVYRVLTRTEVRSVRHKTDVQIK